jgi:hypothetical protein
MKHFFKLVVISFLLQSYCQADSLKVNHIVNLSLGSGASFQKVKDPNESFLIANDFMSYIIKLLMNPSFQIGYTRENRKFKRSYYFRYQLYEQLLPVYNRKNIDPSFTNKYMWSTNSELYSIGFQNEKSFYKKRFVSLNRILGAELGMQLQYGLSEISTIYNNGTAEYYWKNQNYNNIYYLNLLAGISTEFRLANDISLSLILLYSQGTRNALKTEFVYTDQIANKEGIGTYIDRYSQFFLKARICYYITK